MSLMGLLQLFSGRAEEVPPLVDELCAIGRTDGFFKFDSGDEHFEGTGAGGGGSEGHVRAREIGRRLHEIGGRKLMRRVHADVRAQLGPELGTGLEHAWHGIGGWQA